MPAGLRFSFHYLLPRFIKIFFEAVAQVSTKWKDFQKVKVEKDAEKRFLLLHLEFFKENWQLSGKFNNFIFTYEIIFWKYSDFKSF